VKDPVGTLQARVAATNHESIRDGHAIITETHLIDGTRVDDVRIYEPPVQTLQARMGTEGNNVPMLAFDTKFGSNANVFEDQSPTLKASQQSPSVAYPIQDGREIEKNQNGLGVASSGDPSYTLDQTGAQSVAIGIQGTVIGRQDHNGPGGKGHTEEGDPMFTLTSTDVHAIAQSMAVRRLTPLECERLMGWPDDHTRWKADGTEQADTHRYKQCGNGVASPVARWIAYHILNIPKDPAQ
jgi:site-specific DNA-cytosine methylase